MKARQTCEVCVQGEGGGGEGGVGEGGGGEEEKKKNVEWTLLRQAACPHPPHLRRAACPHPPHPRRREPLSNLLSWK